VGPVQKAIDIAGRGPCRPGQGARGRPQARRVAAPGQRLPVRPGDEV